MVKSDDKILIIIKCKILLFFFFNTEFQEKSYTEKFKYLRKLLINNKDIIDSVKLDVNFV